MSHTPRILIFTGDGKGKTTAALGMAFRASGHGLRTCIIQFIKGDASVGEIWPPPRPAQHIEIHPRPVWASFPPTGRSTFRRASGGCPSGLAEGGRGDRRRPFRHGDPR